MNDSHEPGGAPEDRSEHRQDTVAHRAGGVDRSRRRFTGAGLSASVVVTLASRSALANHCSVSGHISGNLSKPHQTPCKGLTPGFWKTHPEEWACGYEPGLCNPITYKNGECKDYDFVTFGELKAAQANISPAVYSAYVSWAGFVENVTPDEALPAPAVPPTTLGEAFAGSGLVFTDPSQTVMQALWDPPEDIEPQTLVAHASAALLNVCRFGEESFGYTRDSLLQFIAQWDQGLEALKDALQMLNERGGG